MAVELAVGPVLGVVRQQPRQLLHHRPRNLLRQPVDYCKKQIRLDYVADFVPMAMSKAPWWRCFLLVGCLF